MARRTYTFVMTGVLTMALCCTAIAVDWPQFRGPNHDGASSEKILTAWPAGGLREVWKQPMTDGFSGITLSGGKAFTLVARDLNGANEEFCVALDANTGKELWGTPLGMAEYDGGGDAGTPDNGGGDGPRSTPTCDGDKVYTYSSRMVLKCMDAGSGKQLWVSDIKAEHAGHNIHWES